jgi:tetratricopeptide (TPR) repeat protein
MIEMGEYDVALDELRWLLNGCGDCIEAHRLLGELALLNDDLKLARGHFGYAYEIGVAAIDQARAAGPFPYERASNQAFLECGKGLASCLTDLGKTSLARQVLERLVQFDPTDPLGAKQMLAELPA